MAYPLFNMIDIHIASIKAKFLVVVGFGTIGTFLLDIFGGWHTDITSLVIFMILDYFLGIIAGVFGKSDKTKYGGLSARAAFLGIIKKIITLAMVMVCHRIDLLIGTDYIRSTAVVGFCVTELLSIMENMGRIGIPLPGIITKAIDILKGRSGDVKKDIERLEKMRSEDSKLMNEYYDNMIEREKHRYKDDNNDIFGG